jgi:hypothetical protein
MDADLAPLPEPAQRYLRFMNVAGRPRDWSFRLTFAGCFRTRIEQYRRIPLDQIQTLKVTFDV